jgi:hypothetical protein
MRWERLGRKVALDVALGLNYLHSQVGAWGFAKARAVSGPPEAPTTLLGPQ